MSEMKLEQPIICQDEARFAMVWERVMGGNDNPIVVGKGGKQEKILCYSQEFEEEHGEGYNMEQVGEKVIFAEKKETAVLTLGGSCLPSYPMDEEEQEDTILCFGEKSGKNLLAQGILATLEAMEEYKKLEKQLPQKLKPQVQELCGKRKKQLNQLETAYFLLVGEDFLLNHPDTLEYIHQKPVPADQRLRRRFREAQIWQGIYQKGAYTSQDSYLTTLFLDLELGMKEETREVHRLVEALFWMKYC